MPDPRSGGGGRMSGPVSFRHYAVDDGDGGQKRGFYIHLRRIEQVRAGSGAQRRILAIHVARITAPS